MERPDNPFMGGVSNALGASQSHEMRVWEYKVTFGPFAPPPRVVRNAWLWWDARMTKKRLRRPKPGSARGDPK